MNRRGTGVARTAAALIAAAGVVSSAQASVTIGPSDVITWGGTGVGRAAPGSSSWISTSATGVTTSGTATLAWGVNVPDDPQIDSGGRVYFRSRVDASSPIGSLTQPRGVFTATNSADISAFLVDGNVVPSGTPYRLGAGLLSSAGLKANSLRVSGSRVGVGVQIGDPSNPGGGTSGTIGGGALNLNETFNNSPTHNIDNSMWYSGVPIAGNSSALAPTIQRNEAVVGLPVNEYNVVGTSGTGTARISGDFSSLTNTAQNFDMNSSGVTTWVGTFYAGTTATMQDPIISNVPNGGGSATASGSRFVATKSAGGSLNILQHNGTVLTGTQAHPYNTGTSVGETIGLTVTTLARINRDGQVAFNSDLSTAAGGVTASTNDTTWIHTPGSGTVMVYREGELYDNTNVIGTRTSLSPATSSRSFSTAGLLYSSALVNPTTPGTPGGVLGDGQAGDGDVTAVVGVANNSALYLSTASATMRILRQNDPAPGLAADVRIGSLTATAAANSLAVNNIGSITVATALQGPGAVAPISGSQLGNNAALFSGTPGPGGTLTAIARLGDAAPGFAGGYYNLATSTVPLINNNSVVLFTSPIVDVTGAYTGTLASHTIVSSALFGWYPGASSPFSILATGQSVEVEAGVFKTISAFSVGSVGNGDGGVQGFNDANELTARLTFSDATWAVVKLQVVPAPGAGGLAVLGLGVLACRRRR